MIQGHRVFEIQSVLSDPRPLLDQIKIYGDQSDIG